MCILVPTYFACGDPQTGHGYDGMRFERGLECPLYPACGPPQQVVGRIQLRLGVLCPECQAPPRGHNDGHTHGECGVRPEYPLEPPPYRWEWVPLGASACGLGQPPEASPGASRGHWA